ncbi:hypothetical protein ACI7RC_19575 [Brevibacillus sp. B_LB10_24]|uniref:hypothetical protein n=1 Tax=Brevibacillus sp. B_LB10_24 TaxID=3380645 RepID=UPI0038BB511B
MERDVTNRYRGLPPRTPDMLLKIVRKFYRGAVSHFDLIQEKKKTVKQALLAMRQTGDPQPLREALTVLFWEFHFYVTCWLQIDLALYRLARLDETSRYAEVYAQYREVIDRHLHVRKCAEDTAACVETQFDRYGSGMSGVEQDAYWFDGHSFTVDQESLDALHRLYRAIMKTET